MSELLDLPTTSESLVHLRSFARNSRATVAFVDELIRPVLTPDPALHDRIAGDGATTPLERSTFGA